MQPVIDGLDLFCRLNIQAEMAQADLVALIARTINGTASGNSVRSATLDISVDENDVFDPALAQIGSKRWLYFRYTLEIDPVAAAPPHDYIACLGTLLRALWSTGLDAVAACAFEDDLPTNDRRGTWTNICSDVNT